MDCRLEQPLIQLWILLFRSLEVEHWILISTDDVDELPTFGAQLVEMLFQYKRFPPESSFYLAHFGVSARREVGGTGTSNNQIFPLLARVIIIAFTGGPHYKH